MIVQVFEMYSYDCDCNDYEEGEMIRVGKDAASASYAILEDADQDPRRASGAANCRRVASMSFAMEG